MNVHYWNRVALSYDHEIFDVYQSNKGRKLQRYLKKHVNKNGLAIDFGCGIGKAFSFLSPSFKNVIGIDISQNCIHTSKEVVAANGYKNIQLKRMDLANPRLNLPACDFAVCVNVAILPDIKKNQAIIKNIAKTLKKNGTGIFVIPSFESSIFATQRMIDWYAKDGVSANEISNSDFTHIPSDKRSLVQGLVRIDSEPTKHYLHAEILALFSSFGLSVTKIEKLEYDWTTEFAAPPAWMNEPFPWDWMVECKKQ